MYLPHCSYQVPFTQHPTPWERENVGMRHNLNESPDSSLLTHPTWYFPNHTISPVEIAGNEEDDDPRDAFTARIDVTPYYPEELSVRVVDDCLIVEGKHEDKRDEHGHISRHFVRRYTLPENTMREELLCKFSSDGILSITAPKIPPEEKKEGGRRLPIRCTGLPGRSILCHCHCCEGKGVKSDSCQHVPSTPKGVEGYDDGF